MPVGRVSAAPMRSMLRSPSRCQPCCACSERPPRLRAARLAFWPRAWGEITDRLLLRNGPGRIVGVIADLGFHLHMDTW